MKKKRILGLDTGSNSLGWAVVDREENGQYTLVDKGVLIFQEGVKIETRRESSKAAERTSYRALRRKYFRRRLRKIEVLKVLIKYNLCPALSEDDLKLWHTRKIYPLKDEFLLWQRTNENKNINPYHSRYTCLTEVLDFNKESDRYMLGRAMYHLAQRRGFMSNRLDANEESESGDVRNGIVELSIEMQKAGCQYLGEYFHGLYCEHGNKVRLRTRYIDREQHYKAEFNAICKKQNLSEEMKKDLECALYFQRPLKSQRQSVGKCTFEKNKARCSESHPLFEEFRMQSFLNNVRVQGPDDLELRPLNEEELLKIKPLFYRVSKPNFDFEDIAKKIAGKGKYQHVCELVDKPYKFNCRMSQGVPGCPTIAQLIGVFGEDWMTGIAETFDLNHRKDGTPKTVEEMACDVWNVLYFFDNKDKLKDYGIEHLQLSEELAEKFVKIRLNRDFSSLSLKAIRNILPFLRRGMLYSHAVFLGNVSHLVGSVVWNDEAQRTYILDQVARMAATPLDKLREQHLTFDICIKDFLRQEYGVSEKALETLYHPSMIKTYPDARPNQDGVVLLGSPRTNAVRNPMAMRSLHELRKVINALIKEGKIGPDTEVHVEYARSLNNANMRAAINDLQRDKDKQHEQYAKELKKLYKEATGRDIEPVETDILKFQLWKEQERVCLYTGEKIGITDFIGAGPKYDIEHTIPRSKGGDSTQENMTLCNSHYNRYVKKAKLPVELAEHEQILVRIESWKKNVEELTKQIDKIRTRGIWNKSTKDDLIRKKNRLKMRRDYWRGKYQRFTMKEVPEGFALRQGAGIGLISKYAALYLKSYFHDVAYPERRQVYSIKGPITAEFRKMWGIQDEYERKSRDSHTHHCIDAIIIACIGKNEFNQMGKFYHDMFDYYEGKGEKPLFPKPWETFTQDLKQISNELLVVHDTPDNMPKKACRIINTPHGKKQAKGDCARDGLHKESYYGAIKHDGEVKYVKRKAISDISAGDIDKIVDEVVREKVRRAFEENRMDKPIYMNEEKGIIIKKVRCYSPDVTQPLHIRRHRDISTKEYKQQFHVMPDGNYCMAIYEAKKNGKVKRTYEIIDAFEAATYYKQSNALRHSYPIAPEWKDGMAYRCMVKTGTHVILLQNEDEELDLKDNAELFKRMYFVAILRKDGRIILRHHKEAREASTIKKERKAGVYVAGEDYRSEISMSLSNFFAFVEGVDFEITPLGEIKLK